MSYQQWNHHHYQPIPESRPLMMQPWQHEFGCPVPRPRSYSLGSRPIGTDLMEVSTKRAFDPTPLLLPVDSNHNYHYNGTKPSKGHSKSRRRLWALLFLLMTASSLSIFGWWKLRRSSVIEHGLPKEDSPHLPAPPPQHHQQYPHQQPHQQQQSSYHPLPPPPASLASGSQQQQQYHSAQPAWQHPPQQQVPPSPQHPSPAESHYNFQQQPSNQYYGHQQQYHAPYYGQQQQQQQPYQHAGHVQQHPYANQMPEMNYYHQGEPVPRKSWMMEHTDNPVAPKHGNDVRTQQQYSYHQPQMEKHEPIRMQQPQMQHHPQMPPPVQQPLPVQQPPTMQQPPHEQSMHVEPVVLSRQEERAKARNEARTMNPTKNSTNSNDIWEENPYEPINIEDSIASIQLRLEPAQHSFSQSVMGSDGTLFLLSFEDDEDVTVEIVEEA